MNSNFPDQRGDHLPTTHEPHLQVAADVSSTPPAMAEIASTGSQVTSKSKGGASRPPFRALIHTVASQDYIGVLTATVVLVLVIGAVHPNFLALGQLLDILNQAAFIAVLACGMAFLLAMRELDLSVGSIYALTSLCAALLMHAGVPS